MGSWPQAKQKNWISKIHSTAFESGYWRDIFERVHAGEIDTWDYQWLYTCWQSGGIGVIPNVNLITNIGAGPDATHTKGPVGSLEIPTGMLGDFKHPEQIVMDRAADQFTFDHHCGGIELWQKHQAVHVELSAINPKTISIVLPFYNEEQNVRIFFAELENATRKLADTGYLLEYICINDGSRDATLDILLSLRSEVACIKVVDLTRNFGKEAGLTAGLDYAEGDALIFMDTDLQHPPVLIPELVFRWASGEAPVILAKRRSRKTDSIYYRYLATAFYRINNKISDIKIPPDIGDYRLIDRQVAEHLKLLPERRRFMKGLFAWVGHPSVFIEYDVQPRAGGMSSFNSWRSWNFALEGMTSFSTAPLRIWTYFGLGISLLAFVYALWIVGKTLLSGTDAPGYASIMTAVMLFGGIQLISIGVLGEYIGRIYMEIKGRPVYLVKRFKTVKRESQS
jgi:glycosyltransferase involved in cell wall biosynthesis